MPIAIYNDSNERIDYLCSDIWELPTQIWELEKWLETKGKKLKTNKYVADIGFNMRSDASGGGAVLNSKMIKILNIICMEIHFSEYPTEK